jgi:hypothetical protein
LSLLSIKEAPTVQNIEQAARLLLDFGIGHEGSGAVIIRSGALGAYVLTRERGGRWISAYWTPEDYEKIADVTGMSDTAIRLSSSSQFNQAPGIVF